MQHFLRRHKRVSLTYFSQRLALTALAVLITFSLKAQSSTEDFETEASGSKSFTNNGVVFNIISTVSTYDIFVGQGYGWNGTGADNRFIDNTGTATSQYPNSSLTIKTTSNLFKVNKFWVYLTDRLNSLSATGSLTVTGKLSGVTKFNVTKSSGFTTTTTQTNGYTLIDLTNFNGMNYANIVIDELTITLGGDFRYMALDAFTWVKDAGIVTLPVKLTSFAANLNKAGLLDAHWSTASETNNSHFILQSSTDGKTWKELLRKDAALNATNGANYQVEVDLGPISLAGFGLLAILLFPISNRRYRMIAIFAVLAIFGISCAKDKDLKRIELGRIKNGLNDAVYLRLAQVDLDGTTTYSEAIFVKVK